MALPDVGVASDILVIEVILVIVIVNYPTLVVVLCIVSGGWR